MNRVRLLCLVAAVGLLALSAGLGYRRTLTWHERGRTGVLFLPAVGVELPSDVFENTAGAVLMVAPGSPAERAGLRPGDVVVGIGGVALSESAAIRRRAGALRRGDRVSLRLKTFEGPRTVELELVSPLAEPTTVAALVSDWVLGLAFLAVGLWVVWARPSTAGGLVFGVCAAGGALFFVRAAGGLDVPDLRGTAPLGLEPVTAGILTAGIVVLVLLHNFLLHLFLVFPARRPVTRRGKALFLWIHTLPFVPCVAATAAVLTLLRDFPGWLWAALLVVMVAGLAAIGRSLVRHGLREGVLARPLASQLVVVAAGALLGPAARHLSDPALTAVLLVGGLGALLFLVVLFLVYSGCAFGSLWRSYGEAGAAGRRRLRWILWGLGVTLEAAALLACGGLFLGTWPGVGRSFLFWGDLLVHALYLLTPLSLAFCLLDVGLGRIDRLCRRSLVWGGVGGFVVLAWLALLGGLGRVLVTRTLLGPRWAAVLALAVAVPFAVPLRRRLETWADRW